MALTQSDANRPTLVELLVLIVLSSEPKERSHHLNTNYSQSATSMSIHQTHLIWLYSNNIIIAVIYIYLYICNLNWEKMGGGYLWSSSAFDSRTGQILLIALFVMIASFYAGTLFSHNSSIFVPQSLSYSTNSSSSLFTPTGNYFLLSPYRYMSNFTFYLFITASFT